MVDEDIELHRVAYELYLNALTPARTGGRDLFSYGVVDAAEHAPWRLPFTGEAVAGDLREMINQIHQWGLQGCSLRAWVQVLAAAGFDEQDAWTVRAHSVEPLATFLLLRPAAMRDSLGNVATLLVHYARLSTEPGYRDVLVQDENNRFLNRPAREKQLKKLAAPWATSTAFLNALTSLDSVAYRKATMDYRNRSSHGIAPRLEEGFVGMTTRTVGAHEDLVKQQDGTHQLVAHPTKKAVWYDIGGTPPLKLVDVARLDLEEYEKAHHAITTYIALARAVIESLPPLPVAAIADAHAS